MVGTVVETAFHSGGFNASATPCGNRRSSADAVAAVRQNKPRKVIERPTYLVESVDNALRLVQMLRDRGLLRLTDAALELSIAPSTAHRLLSMLVYRGFAIQDENRAYHAGPALSAGPAPQGWAHVFAARARPHLEAFATACGESVNLVIRVAAQCRFLSTAESSSILRVGDRQGQVLPAESTAGGRILLAEAPASALKQLYLRSSEIDRADEHQRMSPQQFEKLCTELRAARAAGFAMNVEQTEQGVGAFGVAVHNRTGHPLGAVAVAVPISRFRQYARGSLVPQLKRMTRDLEFDVADIET